MRLSRLFTGRSILRLEKKLFLKYSTERFLINSLCHVAKMTADMQTIRLLVYLQSVGYKRNEDKFNIVLTRKAARNVMIVFDLQT